MIDSLKQLVADALAEFKMLAGSKLAWFLAGVFLSGQDVPSVVNSLRTFVGL